MMPCPVCGKRRPVAEHLATLRNPPPHDPRRCWRCGSKLRRLRFGAALAGGVAVAASLGGCAGLPDTMAAPPPSYDAAQPADVPSPAPPAVGLDQVQTDAPSALPAADAANADDYDADHRAFLAALTGSGIGHDATVAAGGYVAGKQAENVIRRLKRRRSLTAAGETADDSFDFSRLPFERKARQTAEIGAGTVATRRAALRGTIATGEGAAAAEGGAATGEAAGEAAAALGGEELAGAGLALGAGELLAGGLIVGGAILLYEAYENSQHAQEKAGQHDR
jgi:hypothetical protein